VAVGRLGPLLPAQARPILGPIRKHAEKAKAAGAASLLAQVVLVTQQRPRRIPMICGNPIVM
jgi:hypothetical protein